MRTYTQLTREQRCQIYALLKAGHILTIAIIAGASILIALPPCSPVMLTNIIYNNT